MDAFESHMHGMVCREEFGKFGADFAALLDSSRTSGVVHNQLDGRLRGDREISVLVLHEFSERGDRPGAIFGGLEAGPEAGLVIWVLEPLEIVVEIPGAQ